MWRGVYERFGKVLLPEAAVGVEVEEDDMAKKGVVSSAAKGRNCLSNIQRILIRLGSALQPSACSFTVSTL